MEIQLNTKIASTAIVCTLLPFLAKAELSSSGQCRHAKDEASVLIGTTVHWDNDTAIISDSGGGVKGSVVGFRKDGGISRLSIKYKHPIFGFSEIPIFETEDGYRMGFITYHINSSGEQSAEYIEGYRDALCK